MHFRLPMVVAATIVSVGTLNETPVLAELRRDPQGSESGDTNGRFRGTSIISFADIDAGLPGAGLSSVAWGDYDNDYPVPV